MQIVCRQNADDIGVVQKRFQLPLSFLRQIVHLIEDKAVIVAAAEGNKPKMESAPVVAIIAHNTKFYDHIEKLAPHMNADAFRQQEMSKLEQIAIENCWFQAGFDGWAKCCFKTGSEPRYGR